MASAGNIEIKVRVRSVGPLEALMDEQAKLTEECFPQLAEDLRHMALGLAGEVGEVLNWVKKVDRGDFTLDSEQAYDTAKGYGPDGPYYLTVRDLIAEEVTDVLIYVLNMYKALGVLPDQALEEKTEHNRKRFGGRNVAQS